MHQAGSVNHFRDHSDGPLPWEQISKMDKRRQQTGGSQMQLSETKEFVITVQSGL